MAGQIETRLKELGIELPEAAAPIANYVPYVVTGNLVFMAGQICVENGELKFIGKIGREYSIEDGQEAARLCTLNMLAQLRVACDGDLDRVTRCVRIGGFVNSTEDFTEIAPIMNGASDMIVSIFGDKGKHARTGISAISLPLGLAVELDGIFEIAN